jgi:CRISPR/Cas system-associated exonuclease Cas4 (RecB family)
MNYHVKSINEVVSLLDKARTADVTYVFSSEVVSRSYLEAYARKFPNSAIFNDEVLSWDTFSEKFTAYPQDKVRAVFTDRLLFVQHFFKTQDAMKKLTYYCDSNYTCSKPAYMRSIAKVLPNMCKAFDLKNTSSTMSLLDTVAQTAPKDMQADLLLLVPSYKTYLEQHELYDPAFYEPDFTQSSSDGTCAQNYTLVFPQTFSKAYVSKALEVCNSIELDQDALPADFKLKFFSNPVAEIRACLRNIYKLLTDATSNVHPNDIAISCPDFDSYLPYLQQEAYKRDISLTFNNAKPISSYIPGKFFSALLRIKNENYSFASMKDFLLNLEFPYKDREILVSIIKNAVDCKCKEGPLYKWCDKFGRLKYPALAEKKRLLEIDKGLRAVVDCKDPAKLKENVMILVKDLFGEKSWTEKPKQNNGLEYENARIFGSCERELDNLSVHAKDVELDSGESLFSLFVDILKDKTYRPNTGKDNINVYKYPVSAGLAVKYHFVLGLTESNSKVLLNPYPCLPLDKAKTLEEVKALEDLVIGLYSQTMDGGSTWISSVEEGFSGADVIPTIFLKDGRKENVRTVQEDSYSTEVSVWEGKEIEKLSLTKMQKAGFEKAYETGLNYDKSASFALVPLPFTLSVSRVKEFEACPYKGYASCKLKLDNLDFEPNMDDAAQIGDLLHKAFQGALLSANPRSIEAIKENDLLVQFEKVLNDYEKTPNATDKVHIAHIRNKYTKLLPLILDCVEEEVSAQEDKPTDKKTQIELGLMTCVDKKPVEHCSPDLIAEETDEKDIINFTGRMDCLLQDSNGDLAVIDLKKNAKNHHGGKLDKVNLQVAIYAKMLQKEYGRLPKIGGFYSFDEGKFKFVWPKYGFNAQYDNFFYTQTPEVEDVNRSKNEYVDENYKERVRELGRIISQQAFKAEPKLKKTCDTCPFYNLCRGGFQTV